MQEVLRGAPQVAVAQVGCMHRGLAGAGKLGKHAAQQRAAHLQLAPVRLGKGHSGEVQRRQPGLADTEARAEYSAISARFSSLLPVSARRWHSSCELFET